MPVAWLVAVWCFSIAGLLIFDSIMMLVSYFVFHEVGSPNAAFLVILADWLAIGIVIWRLIAYIVGG